MYINLSTYFLKYLHFAKVTCNYLDHREPSRRHGKLILAYSIANKR